LCSAFSISCIKIHDQANRAFHPIHYEGKELEKCYVIDTISLQEKIHLQYNNTIYSIHRSEGIFKIESNDTINSYTFPEIKILQKNLITFVSEKTIYFAKYGNKIFLHHNGDFFTVELLTDDSFSIKKSAIGISSSMPGKIISIHVKKGDKLSEGDAILSIESMKIENIIRADKDCEIDDILFSVGDQVSAEEPLVLLKKN